MKLGDMMKAYRAEHKYTLRDFAEICGISFAQVRLMEKGENTHGGQLTPSIKSLKAVATSTPSKKRSTSSDAVKLSVSRGTAKPR